MKTATSPVTEQKNCSCIVPHGKLWRIHPTPYPLVRLFEKPQLAFVVTLYTALILLNVTMGVSNGSVFSFGVAVSLFFAGTFLVRTIVRNERHNHEQVAANILARKQTQRTLTWATQHSCRIIRYSAAKSPYIPTVLVDELTFDSDKHIAWAAYQNVNVSPRTKTLAAVHLTDPGTPLGDGRSKFLTAGEHAYCTTCYEFKPLITPSWGYEALCEPCYGKMTPSQVYAHKSRTLSLRRKGRGSVNNNFRV